MYDLNEIKKKADEKNLFSELGIHLTEKNQFCCLFHDDKNASAHYYPDEDYHCWCYTCQKNFDVISLYAKKNNITDSDAIKELARKYDIQEQPTEQPNPAFKQAKTTTKTTTKQKSELIDLTNQYKAWNRVLNEKYPNGFRGISIETLNRFNFGYKENFMEKGQTLGDYIVMPNSKFSYNMRHIDQNCDKGIKCRKSANTPQTPFNIEVLSETKPCFLVEGEFDALSIIECGYNAIAVSGQVPEKFYERVKDMNKTEVLIVSLDMDSEKIIKNANDCLSRLKELGANACFPELNENQTPKMYLGCKDANEAFLKDRDAFKTELSSAVEYAILKCEEAKDKYIEENSNQFTSIGFIDRMRTAQREVIPTGFKQLDAKLDGGLYAGLYVLGGVTGTGKTTFTQQIANNLALHNDTDVMTIALEMSKNELIARDISRLTYDMSNKNKKQSTIARYILNPSKDYNMPEKQHELLYLAEQSYSFYANHLYTIEGTGNIKVEDIRTKITEHTNLLGKPPVLIVDYLQILAPTNDRQSDKWNIDKSMLELKRISRDFNIPVIAISSLNRDTYKENGKDKDKDKSVVHISLASFKESGAIEYGSDVVIALDKNSDDDMCPEDTRVIDVNILKNRNGSTGQASTMVFHAKYNYMEEST